MKTQKNIIITSAFFIALFVAVIACNKKFDQPAAPTDPTDLVANTTIKDLKAKHTVFGAYDTIDTDIVISGVVIANDKSGNIYKNLYLQDATGALTLLLDANSLYATYPVGRRVFVKCKGLHLSDYNRMIQLGVKAIISGSPSLEGIPGGLISKYLVGGSNNNTFNIKTVTVSQLTTNMQDENLGNLIQLENYEFIRGDTAKTFADISQYKNSANLTINDCSGSASAIIIRSSGYSNFASAKPPKGKGNIVAVYTTFGTTKQLVLRDTSDIKFKGERCNFYEEDFQSYPTSGNVIAGWRNIAETGDVLFRMSAFSGNIFPLVSAFASATLATTNISTWLVSPDITLPTGVSPKLTFTCSRRYPAGTFKVYVSTNFTGTNVSTATWNLITTVPAGSSNAFTPFDLFGPFNLATYAGQKINIGFRYEANAGTTPNTVGTYEPDDIKITRN
ncbi:MAG: DUF5689 domain-containing protein [Chitinophagaceae bacterium]